MRRVLMQDFGDFAAHLRRYLLHAGGNQIEGLVAAFGQAVLHQDADHLDALCHVDAHDFGEIQGLPRRGIQLLVAQIPQGAQRALDG